MEQCLKILQQILVEIKQDKVAAYAGFYKKNSFSNNLKKITAGWKCFVCRTDIGIDIMYSPYSVLSLTVWKDSHISCQTHKSCHPVVRKNSRKEIYSVWCANHWLKIHFSFMTCHKSKETGAQCSRSGRGMSKQAKARCFHHI